MAYIRPIILFIGILSECYLIYNNYMLSSGGTKGDVVTFMHCALCAFFVYAFIYDIKRLFNKDK